MHTFIRIHLRILPAVSHKVYFWQKYPYARKGVYPLFRHFSNTFELSEFLCERFGYDSTDFSRPRAKRIHQSGDMKDLDWFFLFQKNNILCFSNIQKFSLWKITAGSVFQTYRNSSCWEQQQSLSSRHTESLSSGNTESLSCRKTQYRGGSKRQKLSRNGSRMDDMRNRDRENDRTGPRSIFRPLPDPKNSKHDHKS